MSMVVTDACINCKHMDCVEVCPVEAFYEGPEMLYIDPDTCIDCGACVAECPVSAIYLDQELPENLKHFAEINRRMFPLSVHVTEKRK